MENYFASQRENIFSSVEVLIYVFDVESHELEKDMHYYQSCLEAILLYSPSATVFCLIHKMDLVQEEQRDLVSLTPYKSYLVFSQPICWCRKLSLDFPNKERWFEKVIEANRSNLFPNFNMGWNIVQSKPYLSNLLEQSSNCILVLQAWSSIVYTLIPNVGKLENSLNEFTNIIDADEVLLFERATFLVVSHAQRKHHKDPHRFEKVSNIIKQFKLSCR